MTVSAAANPDEPQDVYLKSFLKPFAPWLEDDEVLEILVNRPGEIWIERAREASMQCVKDRNITNQLLQRLAVQIARVSAQAVNREHPLLSATLPSGERIQMAGPPAAGANWTLAVRRHVTSNLTIRDFAGAEGFDRVAVRASDELSATDKALQALLSEKRIEEFLVAAVRARKSVLISGGTSAGKTSLLNALIDQIPIEERIITVEDAAEVRPRQPNRVSLVAAKGEMGEAKIDIMDLLQAALRMRPDRIILGEIRGVEAAAFLRAVNTGHPGSITTVHADNPRGALDQIALMVMQAGFPLKREETIEYILSIVDTIIQVSRLDGARRITEIMFAPRGARPNLSAL